MSACEPLHVRSVRPLLHQLPDEQLIDTLMDMSGETLASEFARELMLVNLKVIRSDLTLSETYYFSPLPTLDEDIAVYGGTRDSAVRQSTLAQWKHLSNGSTIFRDFEEGHFYMLERMAEFIAQLGQDILSVVEEPRPN